MSEEQNNQEEVEIEVVELEADNGEREEYIIINRVEIKGNTYVIMMDYFETEDMTFEEYLEMNEGDEEPLLVLMRQDGENFMELTEEEYEEIKEELDAKLAEMES